MVRGGGLHLKGGGMVMSSHGHNKKLELVICLLLQFLY